MKTILAAVSLCAFGMIQAAPINEYLNNEDFLSEDVEFGEGRGLAAIDGDEGRGLHHSENTD